MILFIYFFFGVGKGEVEWESLIKHRHLYNIIICIFFFFITHIKILKFPSLKTIKIFWFPLVHLLCNIVTGRLYI